MKAQSLADNIALKNAPSCKKKDSASRIQSVDTATSATALIFNARGMTLIELMVTVAISSLVTMAAATLFTWTTQQFQIAMEKNRTQENLLWASYEVRSFLSQAVNLQTHSKNAVGPRPSDGAQADCRNSTGAPAGCIMLYYNTGSAAPAETTNDLNVIGNLDGSVDCLARFYREAGLTDGKILDSAIFFRRPDTTPYANGVYDSGTLYISSAPVGGPGAITVGPDSGNMFFDNLTSVSMVVDEVNDTIVIPGPPITFGATTYRAKSARVTLTGRYFKVADRKQWVYCPNGIVGAPCDATNAYQDETVVINVNFRNNVLRVTSATGDTCGDRLFGCMYFYRNSLPITK